LREPTSCPADRLLLGLRAAGEQVTQVFFNLRCSDEQQFVAALEWLIGLGHDDAISTQDCHDCDIAGQRKFAHRPSAPGGVIGKCDLHQVCVALAKLDEPHQIPDSECLFDQ